MEYDYEEIQAMGAGDLVHLMLLEFECPGEDDGVNGVNREPCMQSGNYFWAHARLNELLAGRGT